MAISKQSLEKADHRLVSFQDDAMYSYALSTDLWQNVETSILWHCVGDKSFPVVKMVTHFCY